MSEAVEQRLSALNGHYGGVRNRLRCIGKRTRAVERALEESESIALKELSRSLGDIGLEPIWPLLRQVCRDFAIYTGGGAIAGGAVGAGFGVFFFGAGAVPGGAAGAVLGAQAGNLLLVFLGLKSVVQFMVTSIPRAADAYCRGLRMAWGRDPDQRDALHGYATQDYFLAAQEIARGHNIFVMALLTGIVTYLTLGRGNLQRLVVEARESAKLGPKMAAWLEQNSQKLIDHPILRSSPSNNVDAAPLSTAKQVAIRDGPETLPTASPTDAARAARLPVPEVVAAARIRQANMLSRNVGYNISPTAWDEYPTIGLKGTFVTDGQAIKDAFGEFGRMTEIEISAARAARIETDMGLVPGTLQDGIKVREVVGLQGRQPMSALAGNAYFLGAGSHLPGGAPEMVVDSIPTVDNSYVKTILTVRVTK